MSKAILNYDVFLGNSKKRLLIKLFFLLFYCISGMKANAQYSIGLSTGLSINHLTYNGYHNGIAITNGTGSSYILILKRNLSQTLSLDLNPGVVQKNYFLTNQNGIQQKIINDYLNVPLMLSYNPKLFNGFSGVFSLGAYSAYWLSSKIKGQLPNVFESGTSANGTDIIQLDKVNSNYQFNKASDQRIEYGPASSVALHYNLTRHIDLSTIFQFFYSLSSMQKKRYIEPVSQRNITQLYNLGIIYHLNNTNYNVNN
ncbi:hypothetical protein [Mucilaginibacter polytrichastri]|uniref:Outer membrane protein beta-barrel domain-containing protein n=1 Tax=Mucilaginibacter polytrichastri TaxID=1302689 RepID=A0A1Q5ZWE5_9SPHI|nr:hypothetical protein [Mucilaginibacter polytrichastri]OKS86063.1 hypothetical protein RG47T_1510 [Mucilaginibacter polytrichastri]SFS59216.1 hypothetical protein SAMN04487890_10278 [Mucilaginibacter polytrichastri]